jgi:hypothetical protein
MGKMKHYEDEVIYTWDKLVDMDLFTDRELELITNINGYTMETLNDAIYSRYGYRSLEQLTEEIA